MVAEGKTFQKALFFGAYYPVNDFINLATMPFLRHLPPGFQRIHHHTIHVLKFPGLNPKGDNIVFIHGIAAFSSTWAPLIKSLLPIARSFLVFDLPGHGMSPAPEPPFTARDAYFLARDCLVRNLDPDAPNLIIGNSLGGGFAFRFCYENPEFARRSVLISPAGAPFPVSARAVISRFLVKSFGDACKMIEDVWTHPTKANYLTAPLIMNTAKQPGFISMMQSLIDIDKDPDGPVGQLLFQPEMVKNYHIPTLFIWGQEDRILPVEMRNYFDQYLPDTTTRFFPEDLGHCPHLENAPLIARQIIDWRKKLLSK